MVKQTEKTRKDWSDLELPAATQLNQSEGFRRTNEEVVAQVQSMILRGELKPGDRLPPERELAERLGISRPSLRAGLRMLIGMGLLRTRHGSGTYVADGPPSLGSETMKLMAVLHGFTQAEIFEARRALEALLVGMAAERATGDQLAGMAEEMANMYAVLDDPQQFLLHDIRFHRAIAAASGNPILATLVEMVSAMHYERRSQTISRARDLKESAEMHRAIYQAIRAHRPDAARRAMSDHLLRAQKAYDLETVAAQIQPEITDPDPAPKSRGRRARLL